MSSLVPEVPCLDGEEGNCISSSPAVKWCFTLNNFTNNDIKYILETTCAYGFVVFENEIGDSGTPHLQGFVKFLNKKRPMSIYKDEYLHKANESPTNKDGHLKWSKCRGDELANWSYCTEDYRSGVPNTQVYHNRYPAFEKWFKEISRLQKQKHTPIRVAKCKYTYDQLVKHQKKVVDLIINTEPDDRSIHVWWSKKYSTKKTTTMRFMLINHPELVLQIPSGKSSDIINTIIQADMDRVKAVFINLVGADSEGYPIEALEQIKDACVACGKYKGGAKTFDYVHVIIFANKPPEKQIFEVMDINRWIINEIVE